MKTEEKDILNPEELSPENKKKFDDYSKRLTTFQDKLSKLEEKYQVRAQMTYRMIYADLKIYEDVKDIDDSAKEKADEAITEAVDKVVNKD